MKKNFLAIPLLFFVLFFTSCSATKFVPENSYLLDDVILKTDNKNVKPSTLRNYIHQSPNNKWLGLMKIQLWFYSLSGSDSTRWHNRFFRKIGDPPIIYSESDARRSAEEITKAVYNMGYMKASVENSVKIKKKKLKQFYRVTTDKPYYIRTLTYDIADALIAGYLAKDTTGILLKAGMIFDVNLLDIERQRITNLLVNNGYYKFQKDYITYTADTVSNSYAIDLTLRLHLYQTREDLAPVPHQRYLINRVNLITEYDMLQSASYNLVTMNDSIFYNGYAVFFKDKLYLRPKVLTDNIGIQPGAPYREQDVQRTYVYLGRLPALKYTNIRFTEVADTTLLNCSVMLSKSKHLSVTAEVEGTNSAGDFGAATVLSFQHRNLFRGSESFLLKFRGAYEAISGLQQGYKNDNYTEFGVETSINFPIFLFPFLSSDVRRRIRATTEFALQYNSQLRPEFSRTVASASWSYKWTRRRKAQHRIDLIDINYLYMPWKSDQFVKDYLTDGQNYVMEYNYKDRLIVRTGYMYNYNSSWEALGKTVTADSYSIRMNFESAGNILSLISNLVKRPKNEEGEYSLLNIPFAQYVKADFDFAKNVFITPRNILAFHFAAGIAIPYGNARVIPFEKQYFSGGANSVRGWSVRGLGPGSYSGGDGKYLNQFGEIKLDANVEYRSKLFWKFQGAVFIDTGNIWTTREYENQPGGMFKFNSFYKQIAVSYGLGLRFDFDFFVIRLDGGMKAINPVYDAGKDRYPIVYPTFKRDFVLHFAVGYPF
ncbi:Outer membrane protein assembly factor BamA [termite gut metagenome]|uniref:Outer membrane protein assembly factor BamA n=1 Tax=termite gut metagenome TaxID=433724 RepID=A0A5J4SHC1_9ZZZZ